MPQKIWIVLSFIWLSASFAFARESLPATPHDHESMSTASLDASTPSQLSGVTALYFWARFNNKDVRFESLVNEKYIGQIQGSSLLEIKTAAEDMGFHALPLEDITYEFLMRSPGDLLLHLSSDPAYPSIAEQYLLLLGFEDDMALVFDPSRGFTRMNISSLLTRMSGYGLILSHSPIARADIFWTRIKGRLLLLLILLALFIPILLLRNKRRAASSTTDKPTPAKHFLGQAAVVFLFAVSISLMLNARPALNLLKWETSKKVRQKHFVRFFPTINRAEAIKLHEAGLARFVDARLPRDFAKGHIPDAINIPVYDSPPRIEEFRHKLQTADTIVVYCKSDGCPFAKVVANILIQDLGFENVVLYEEGWKDWDKKSMISGSKSNT